jgi:hypothetical protein
MLDLRNIFYQIYFSIFLNDQNIKKNIGRDGRIGTADRAGCGWWEDERTKDWFLDEGRDGRAGGHANLTSWPTTALRGTHSGLAAEARRSAGVSAHLATEHFTEIRKASGAKHGQPRKQLDGLQLASLKHDSGRL